MNFERVHSPARTLRSASVMRRSSVHDVDAARGRSWYVDVVNADAGAADDGEPRRRVEDLRRHLRLAPDDERVDVGEARREVGLSESGRRADLASFAEQDKTVLGERIGHVDDGSLDLRGAGSALELA